MIYFLDFDRTMFDTDAFIRDLRLKDTSLDACAPTQLASVLEDRIRQGVLSFEPGELAPYVYPDAAQFLRDKENAVAVITYGPRAFQEAKTKSAFHGIPRVSVMYTENVRKGPFLAPHTHLHRDAVLADDTVEELELLTEACPDIRLFEMRRDGASGDGRWPVIRALTELP